MDIEQTDNSVNDSLIRQHQSKMNLEIGYYCCSNIQHLPPIMQLYPLLGGVILTTDRVIYDFALDKYANLNLQIMYCKSISEARSKARELRLRVIISTSYHQLYCGKSVQIFHGGLSDKRYLECARLITYDLVLFPGQKSVDKVKLATTLDWIKEWHIVGYPKFDAYINGDLKTPLRFNNNRKVILYAPTWVTRVAKFKPGTRSKYGESSLESWG